MALRQLDAEHWELDSYVTSHRFLGAGCGLIGMGATLGMAVLGLWADGHPMRPLAWGILALLGLGSVICAVGLFASESLLLSGDGVRLRHGRRERMLARCDEIHSLALDASARLPRRWRLILIRRDGRTVVMSDYDPSWESITELGATVAGALAVPLRLPEGVERDRQLEVLPGEPLTVHYPEFLKAAEEELKGLCLAFLLVAGAVGVAVFLRSRGVI